MSSQRDGSMEYRILDQGDQYRDAVASFPDSEARSRASFEQGDACSLRPDLGQFDAVLAANLLCRLPEPRCARALVRASSPAWC